MKDKVVSAQGIFSQLGISKNPVMLAPLAGVSDHPFRRVCVQLGADLSYVEMISAAALVHNSAKTFKMMTRHPTEKILGVQITARSAQEMGEAVAILDQSPFDTIDINMGCPVKKVVRSGCGAAILQDRERVHATVKAAVQATSKPVSAKIRLGWDHGSRNFLDVARAVEDAGASWLVVHGRTRSDTYQDPVDLEAIFQIKQSIKIPVIANGNIFSHEDYAKVMQTTGADGVMISRGALGNPWLFTEIKQGAVLDLSFAEWLKLVNTHLTWQNEAYGASMASAVCMRKHLVWYASSWPKSSQLRQRFTKAETFTDISGLLCEYACEIGADSHPLHRLNQALDTDSRFVWDPKFDLDRAYDRPLTEEIE